MTEDKLEELRAKYQRLQNLAGWLDVCNRSAESRRKLEALFEVSGWLSQETLNKCIALVKPELEAVRVRLEREWEEA